MTSSVLKPSCRDCQWVQKSFRARANAFCLRYEMVIHDPLVTFCADLSHPEKPELAEALRSIWLEPGRIYVWVVIFRRPAGAPEEPAYRHEEAALTDITTYRTMRAGQALAAYQALQAARREA